MAFFEFQQGGEEKGIIPAWMCVFLRFELMVIRGGGEMIGLYIT